MTQHYQLQLTPIEDAQQAAETEQRLSQYRRDYWQQYKQTHKRVYGTLSTQEYAALKTQADANGRSLWQEIWQQSQAYRQQQYLPSEAVQQEITGLYAELREMNNQLSQLSDQQSLFGKLRSPKKIAQKLAQLEQRIEQFTQQPWIKS